MHGKRCLSTVVLVNQLEATETVLISNLKDRMTSGVLIGMNLLKNGERTQRLREKTCCYQVCVVLIQDVVECLIKAGAYYSTEECVMFRRV